MSKGHRSGGCRAQEWEEGGRGASQSGNGVAAGPGRAQAARVKGNFRREPWPRTSTLAARSPGRVKGGERAQREPEGRFHALAHLSDGPALARAYRRHRADAAVGVNRGRAGAIRAGGLGSTSPGAARTAAGAAVPPSTDPTCPYPPGCRADATIGAVGVRGHAGPRRRA